MNSPAYMHDHLIMCPRCEMPLRDIRDCPCSGDPVTYAMCGYCRQLEDYDETERKRNACY